MVALKVKNKTSGGDSGDIILNGEWMDVTGTAVSEKCADHS